MNIDNNLIIIIIAALWTIPWKGIALWKAARRGDRGWFVALLLLNTLALLEIIYLLFISKRAKKEGEKPTTSSQVISL